MIYSDLPIRANHFCIHLFIRNLMNRNNNYIEAGMGSVHLTQSEIVRLKFIFRF